MIRLTAWGAALAVAAVFVWILGDLLWRGLGELSPSLLLEAPRDAGRAGGLLPILVSTLAILGVCLAVSVPLGVAAAAFLAGVTGRGGLAAGVVRRLLDALAAMPSIVFGLFGSALFSKVLGLGLSILSGGLTLSCMVLPILIRSTEEGLRAVPAEYRHGAAALALSRWTTLWHILLPAAAPAIGVGLALGIGRALAETAALIFTSGYVDRMPGSLLDSGRALSVHIYDLAMNVPGGTERAYATALVLIGLVSAVNGAALWLNRRLLATRSRT